MKGRTWRKRRYLKEKYGSAQCDAKYEDLIRQTRNLGQWLKQNGMKKHCLQPRNFTDTGRGMMALRLFTPGDVIVSIPQNLLITADTVVSSELGKYLKLSKPKLSLQQALSLFLLMERQKGEASFWMNYIKSTPSLFTTPGYFLPEEKSQLPERLQVSVGLHITKLRKAYKQVEQFCMNFSLEKLVPLTFESFRWAWYTVNSRSVYYERKCCHLQEENSNMALAPFLDLLNHSAEAKSEARFNVTNKCYEITTLNTYRKYDQVFISYGPHDNHKLFIEYGFILPNNPQSVYTVTQDDIYSLAAKHTCEYLTPKWKILQDNQLLTELCCSDEGISWKLETVLKILLMDWMQLQNWKQIIFGSASAGDLDKKSRSLARVLINFLLLTTSNQLKNQLAVVTYHDQISQQLLQEDFIILQTSIKLL